MKVRIPADTMDVAFLVGHDDDVVLDPRVAQQLGRAATGRASKWEGMQSDLAIVDAVKQRFPQLDVSLLHTVDELRATEAEVVVVLSYKTQMSFAWYASFFDALRALEAKGTAVYPSADFKETISSKARYTKLLKAAGLPMCPTEILERADCVDASGALVPSHVNARLATALTSLSLLRPTAPTADHRPAFHLVTKPSNADGGFGVAFWEAAACPAPTATATAENTDVQHTATATATATGATCAIASTPSSAAVDSSAVECGIEGRRAALRAPTPLLDSLHLRTMLTAGHEIPPALKPRGGTGSGGADGGADVSGEGDEGDEGSNAFLRYLRAVGFAGRRPHVLLQPLVPTLAQHFEIKIYCMLGLGLG